jgi:hypothetical protein
MPGWTKQYKVRRSTGILSFAVKQNHELLEIAGEPCYLVKRLWRSNSSFQVADRRVPTLTMVLSGFDTDPTTGYIRGLLWEQGVTPDEEYPDQGTFTCTAAASGGTGVWEQAIDKYSFIENRNEYCFDEIRDELDSTGALLTNKVYIIFNTPPFHIYDTAICNFGIANPLTNFKSMQPMRDNQTTFRNSIFGYEQWLKPSAKIRTRPAPHRFLLAFPNTLTDFTITESGLLRSAVASHWTTPYPTYSPKIVEHDVIVRASTGQRFQVTNYTEIRIEDIVVSQHFDLSEYGPESSVYSVPVITT